MSEDTRGGINVHRKGQAGGLVSDRRDSLLSTFHFAAQRILLCASRAAWAGVVLGVREASYFTVWFGKWAAIDEKAI